MVTSLTPALEVISLLEQGLPFLPLRVSVVAAVYLADLLPYLNVPGRHCGLTVCHIDDEGVGVTGVIDVESDVREESDGDRRGGDLEVVGIPQL